MVSQYDVVINYFCTFFHMARDGDLSLAVLQGSGSSPVGYYELSVLERWLPLRALGVITLWYSTVGLRLI